MLPVERGVVDWEREAVLAPLYSLASLYKYAKACYLLELGKSCLNKIGAAHHCPSSVWIWRKTINPLMSYIKPQITPPSPLIFAFWMAGQNGGEFSGSGITTWKTRRKYSPSDLAGGGGTLAWGLVWLIFFNGYSFLMISPNLLDFWVMFFLILSRCRTLHLLIVFRT
jgi:hypothetical protein